MIFFKSIKLFFINYANFKGISSRSDFWYAQLFLIAMGLITTIVDQTFFKYTLTGSPVNDIFNIMTIVPIYSLSCRRLHDIGKSGWWVLLQLTIIGAIPLIYWYCQPSLKYMKVNDFKNEAKSPFNEEMEEKNIWDENK